MQESFAMAQISVLMLHSGKTGIIVLLRMKVSGNITIAKTDMLC